jgi:hypothetical protein
MKGYNSNLQNYIQRIRWTRNSQNKLVPEICGTTVRAIGMANSAKTKAFPPHRWVELWLLKDDSKGGAEFHCLLMQRKVPSKIERGRYFSRETIPSAKNKRDFGFRAR